MDPFDFHYNTKRIHGSSAAFKVPLSPYLGIFQGSGRSMDRFHLTVAVKRIHGSSGSWDIIMRLSLASFWRLTVKK